jgi:hypothetical protein
VAGRVTVEELKNCGKPARNKCEMTDLSASSIRSEETLESIGRRLSEALDRDTAACRDNVLTGTIYEVNR